MSLPSLHLPVIAIAGFLCGAGVSGGIVLAGRAIDLVMIGLVLIAALEMIRLVLRTLMQRYLPHYGAEEADEPDEEIHPEVLLRLPVVERIVFFCALLAGLLAGWLFWGPVLMSFPSQIAGARQ